MRGVRSKLLHAKDIILHPLRAVIFRLRGRNTRIQEPPQTASTTQLPIHSSTGDPTATQDEEMDLPALELYTGDQQMPRTSMDVDEEIDNLKNPQHDLSDRQSRKGYRARSRDPEDSNSFTNPVDTSSVLDIIQAVQRLNAELDQNGPYIVDSLEEDLEFSNVTTGLMEEGFSTVQRAAEHVGVTLIDLLGTKTSDNRVMLLQIAVQAYLASTFCGLASPEASERRDNGFDDDIHDSIHATGELPNTRAHSVFQLTRRGNNR